MVRQSYSTMSLANTPFPSVFFHSMRKLSGTFSQIWPVATTPSISVEPMPVPKAPKAPDMQVWESVPTTSVPGWS